MITGQTGSSRVWFQYLNTNQQESTWHNLPRFVAWTSDNSERTTSDMQTDDKHRIVKQEVGIERWTWIDKREVGSENYIQQTSSLLVVHNTTAYVYYNHHMSTNNWLQVHGDTTLPIESWE